MAARVLRLVRIHSSRLWPFSFSPSADHLVGFGRREQLVAVFHVLASQVDNPLFGRIRMEYCRDSALAGLRSSRVES